MAYSSDLPAAARRHLSAAEALLPSARKDVAGYLFGIAAECAIKAMMIEQGFRPLDASKRRDDPFFAHFPELRTMLRDLLGGRRAAPLTTYIFSDTFMTQWDVAMRYSNGKDIQDHWISSWADSARHAVSSIGT